MREIKFRAWSEKENKYYYEVGFHRSIMMWNDGYKKNDLGALTVSPGFKNYTIEQYTGLKDKNGKKIYEGDICNVDDGENIYEIIFYMGGFMVAVLPRKIRIYHIGDSLFNNIEVIGNIHENPELLNA